MHKILLIILAITPVSAITQIFWSYLLCESLTRICYSFLSITPIRQVFLSAIHIRPLYLHSHCFSNSSKLRPLAHRINYQVLVSSVHMRQYYHVPVLSLSSPFRFNYFYHLQVSASQIKYSSQVFAVAALLKLLKFSTPNRYPITVCLLHRLLLSPYYTVAAQTTLWRYSFQRFVSVTPSFSYQLLFSALVTGIRYYSFFTTRYCITLINQSFQPLLSGAAVR